MRIMRTQCHRYIVRVAFPPRNTRHRQPLAAHKTPGFTLHAHFGDLVFAVFQIAQSQPAQIIGIAPSAGARESRRIVGRSCMAIEEYKSGRIFEDTVCYSFWFVDVHLDAGGSRIEYLTSGATPALRYSAMVPEKLENVLAAGRCVSTDRDTNSALRVKSTCMALGQAAGLAAAIAVKDGIESMADIPAKKLRKALSAAGAIVPGIDDFRDFRTSME